MVKLSLIIPVYNVEKYLKDCLESVINQNFSDMEIICIEGGSMDHSLDILREYAEKDERIHILNQERGKGLSDARNIGLRHAKGKYVWFIDSDDMITQDSCSELYDIAEKNNTDMLFFNMSIKSEITSHQRMHDMEYMNHYGIMSGRDLFCRLKTEKGWKVSAWRKLFRRDFLIENDLYFCEGILMEDVLFSFECFMVAQRVMDINKNYYIYRQRYGSLVTGESNKRAESYLITLSRIYVYWNTHTFTMEEDNAIKDFFYHYVRGFRFSLIACENKPSALGNYPEQVLYKLFSEGLEPLIKLSEEQILMLKNSKSNILYGAGRAAVDILDFLQKENIKVDVIAVSNLTGNPNNIRGIRVFCIDELTMYKDATVIVGVTSKHADAIIDTLKSKGFSTILKLQDCIKST